MLDAFLIEYRSNVQDIVAITVCAAAIIWGGGPERAVAATWLIVFEVAGRVQDWIYGDGVQLTGVDWFVASSDAVAGILMIGIALYANRNYTLLIAAMQVLAVTAHLARGLAEPIAPIAYAVMFIVPGWAQLALLGVGLVRHLQRRGMHGHYRDWRITKPTIRLGGVPISLGNEAVWQQARQASSAPSQVQAKESGQQPSWRDDLK